MKFGFKRILRDESASQIAEAALVLPLAFMMLLGIYWFGRAFNVYATINHAAREGARAAVAQTCATCGNGDLSPASVATIVQNALQASNVDPGQVQKFPATLPANTCAGITESCDNSNNNITVCTNAPLTPPSPPNVYPQVCGVSISFQYPYQMSLPFTSLNQQQFLLKANVQMKGEY